MDGWMGLGEDRAVEAERLAGSGWVGGGSHGAQEGLRTGCGEEHAGYKATGLTSEGATEVKLWGPDSSRPT